MNDKAYLVLSVNELRRAARAAAKKAKAAGYSNPGIFTVTLDLEVSNKPSLLSSSGARQVSSISFSSNF